MINIQIDTRTVERSLNDLGRKQLPFATSLAINDVLTDVKVAEPAAIEKEIDRPTPFTKRGVFVKRATKRALSGIVGYKDIQAAYLSRLATGGKRSAKGRAIVVPVGQRVNKYGNMPRGALKRALAKPNVFSGKVNGVAGIWQSPKRRAGGGGSARRTPVKGSGVKLLAIYRAAVSYSPRVKFQTRGRALIAKGISPALAKRVAQAIKTARR